MILTVRVSEPSAKSAVVCFAFRRFSIFRFFGSVLTFCRFGPSAYEPPSTKGRLALKQNLEPLFTKSREGFLSFLKYASVENLRLRVGSRKLELLQYTGSYSLVDGHQAAKLLV